MNENSPPYVFEKQNDLEKISSDLATITVSYCFTHIFSL